MGPILGGFFTSRKSMFGQAIYLMIWPPVESEDKNLVFNHISIDSVKGKFSSRCLPMQNLRSDNHLAANYESKALADNPKQDNQTTKPNMQLAWQWLLNWRASGLTSRESWKPLLAFSTITLQIFCVAYNITSHAPTMLQGQTQSKRNAVPSALISGLWTNHKEMEDATMSPCYHSKWAVSILSGLPNTIVTPSLIWVWMISSSWEYLVTQKKRRN